MNGAEYIVKALQEQQTNCVFGYPGGAIMPLYDAFYSGGIEHVLCRHEQGAAIAALGYARSTGKVGVCIATSGPGATNLITGLADALLDSVPVVAITGQVASTLIGTDAFQEIDMLGLSLACTKHSFLVESLEDIPRIMAEAFMIASSGRPGPVLIDVPKDILLAAGSLENYCATPHPMPVVTEESLSAAKVLLKNAKKPIVYLGGGARIANAVSEIRDFLQETGIPCVETLKALGTADNGTATYLGMVGMHGSKASNYAVHECDLLFAIGVRFDDRATGKVSEFAEYAKVIHLDIDASEIGKLKQVDIALRGDMKNILPILAGKLSIQSWIDTVMEMKEQHKISYDHPGSAIYAPLLLKQLSDKLCKDTIIVTDVGQHQMWVAQHMSFTEPKNYITSGGLGTMGFSLPAAMGAQIARPGSPVVCIAGDGSFMMNVQELATIRRKNLPIKIILIDNQCLGMVRQWQQIFFGARYSEIDLSDNPDFVMLAKAFGIEGKTIRSKEEVPAALESLLTSEGPCLLHVKIDTYENVWPLVPAGHNNSIMLESVS